MNPIQCIENFINGELQIIADELIEEQQALVYEEFLEAQDAAIEEAYRRYAYELDDYADFDFV
jgi:hypothetical protein